MASSPRSVIIFTLLFFCLTKGLMCEKLKMIHWSDGGEMLSNYLFVDRWRHGFHRGYELHPQGPACCQHPRGRQPGVQDRRLWSGQADRGQWVHSQARLVHTGERGVKSEMVRATTTPCCLLSWCIWLIMETRCSCCLWWASPFTRWESCQLLHHCVVSRHGGHFGLRCPCCGVWVPSDFSIRLTGGEVSNKIQDFFFKFFAIKKLTKGCVTRL